MRRYKVRCNVNGHLHEHYIQCREMTISHSAYCFWAGEHGETNRLIYSFPIMFTIVEGLPDGNSES
jgi:hypothetical protein